MYGGSMYGGGMGMGRPYGMQYGGMNNMNNQNGQEGQANADPNAEYQFDLSRDLQTTVGGLNASFGLAYGIAQMASLGSVAVKQ